MLFPNCAGNVYSRKGERLHHDVYARKREVEMHRMKLEAQKQWNRDPCGANSASGYKEASLEYFEAARDYRYQRYAPWMVGAIDFGRFRGKTVLEIGPGLGTDLLQFAMSGARPCAIDLAWRHLDLTRENLRMHGYCVPCSVADTETLPFKNEVFDCVYAFGVLHHTPNIVVAVEEIHRVLRSGGKVIVALYHRDSAYYWVTTIVFRGLLLMGLARRGYRRLMSEIEFRSPDSDAVPLVRVYSRREVRKLFAKFRNVEIRTWHFEYNHLFPIRRIYRLFAGWNDREKIRAEREVLPSSGGFREKLARSLGWYVVVEAEK
jgi:SAM-dependent methyltransferase